MSFIHLMSTLQNVAAADDSYLGRGLNASMRGLSREGDREERTIDLKSIYTDIQAVAAKQSIMVHRKQLVLPEFIFIQDICRRAPA